MITVNTMGPFFAATAQDRNGGLLGQSPTVKVEK